MKTRCFPGDLLRVLHPKVSMTLWRSPENYPENGLLTITSRDLCLVLGLQEVEELEFAAAFVLTRERLGWVRAVTLLQHVS